MSVEIDDECVQWFSFLPTTPTWDDIATWHDNSSFHCVPHSLESITAWIALEGGKNGCSTSQLQSIIKRHTPVRRSHRDDELSTEPTNQSSNQHTSRISNTMSNSRHSETPHINLDLTVMEYWWSHLREHPALTFTHAVSPLNLSDDMHEQIGSVQLHEDGVLIYPFDRADIPFSELSLSYSACIAHYPTLRVTASPSIRRQVLGWYVPHPMPFNATYVGSHSRANKSDPPDESVALLKAGYCLLETVGKAAWSGMYQAYLHVLLGSGHSLSSLYPAINHLRFQNLVNLTNDYGKPKIWLSTWRQRCVSSRVWCDKSARQLVEWCADHPRVELTETPFDDFGEDIHCDENLWKVHYTPELLMDMPWVYQIYRTIHNAGTKGTTSIEIRNKLGGFGMKTIDSFLSIVADLFKVKAVADRQGKLFVYRYYTEENFNKSESGRDDVSAAVASGGDAAFQPLKEPKLEVHPAFFHERKSLTHQHVETPGTPRSPATSNTDNIADVVEIPSTPVSTSGVETDSVKSSLADTSSTRLGGQRATTLLQNRRVQYVLDALEKAENQIVSCSSLNRRLAEAYPPLMTKQTASKFYTVMQTDGLIDIRSFIFASRSGKKMQPILVARRRALNEHLDAESDAKVQELMKQVGFTEQRFKYRTGEFKIAKVKAEVVDHQELDETTEVATSTSGTAGRTGADSAMSDASDDGSGVEIEHRGKQRQRERSAYQRCMFGWISPPVPRARWLHYQLFSEYMSGPNPVVRRDVDGSLTFSHEELNSQLIWRDFLLLVGVEEALFLNYPEVMDSAICDKPLHELPESFREVVQLRSKKQIPLLGTLHLMRELGLIEPYVHTDLEWGAYVDKYRLIEIKNVEQDTYDFKEVDGRDSFWSRLYQITTRHLKSEQILAFAEPFGLSAQMCKYLSNNRQWLIRAAISEVEKTQLDAFDSSSSHPGRPLSIQQILRASTLLGRSVVVLYAYYCQKYYPHLYDVHVRTQAVGEKYISLKFKGTGVKPSVTGVAPFSARLMKVRRRRTEVPVSTKRRKTGRDTSARVESETSNIDEDDDSSDEDSQDNDSATEGQVRAERYHYSEEMTLAIIAALREWLELHQIDVEEYEGLEIPENVKDHPWLPKIAPLLAAAQFAEIAQRTQLVQEAQAVRVAMLAKKKQQATEIDLESRKNFVLQGQELPAPPPVIEVPVRTKEVPDLSMKTRLNFIHSRIPPGPSYYQLSCYLDRIRKRLQIRTVRSAYGKSLEYKHVSELLNREPHLVGLFNLLLTAVLQPDHLYDANVAHQTVSGYSDDDVGQMIRAMQDDYVVSRKRLNVRGQQRSYQASGRFQEAIRVVGSVADVHDNVRQMSQMIEDMEMAPFGTSWPVLPDTLASSAWAIMEELTRAHVDLDIEEVRPPPMKQLARKPNARSHFRTNGQSNNRSNDSDEEYEPSGNADMSVVQEREAQQAGAEMEEDDQPNNQSLLWALPAMESRSNVFTSSWMSLFDLNTLSEVPTRPYISQSSNQLSNNSSSNRGLPHHEFGAYFGVSTSFGDSVLALADEFDQNYEDEQSHKQSITESEIDPVSQLYESNGQQIDAFLQSAEVIALADTLRDILLKSGKSGLNIDQLLKSIDEQTSAQSNNSSITRLSVVPIPSLNTQSSTFDFALSRLLSANHAFVAPGYNQFVYVHQAFAQQWQVPDSRSVNEILDEERSWYKEISQSNPQTVIKAMNKSITSPLYAPSALQAWPWRQLHGDINEELYSRMLDSVVAAVSDAIQLKQPINQSNNRSNNQSAMDHSSITEDFIALQMKSCTRMQIRALLATLIVDGRVHESAHFDEQGNMEMRYQPSDTIACYWLTEKQTS